MVKEIVYEEVREDIDSGIERFWWGIGKYLVALMLELRLDLPFGMHFFFDLVGGLVMLLLEFDSRSISSFTCEVVPSSDARLAFWTFDDLLRSFFLMVTGTIRMKFPSWIIFNCVVALSVLSCLDFITSNRPSDIISFRCCLIFRWLKGRFVGNLMIFPDPLLTGLTVSNSCKVCLYVHLLADNHSGAAVVSLIIIR